MLTIKGLVASYGHIEVLHGIDMEVGDREIVALIGSNGAGKTTLLNAISGHVQINSGEIRLDDTVISHSKANVIAHRGIIQVPEGRHVYPGLTVEDNLMVGTVAWKGMRVLAGDVSAEIENVYTLFPRLRERRKQLGWSLSGGEQQMLAIGRALMGQPKLLMLDEPSMGLAPLVIEELFEKIVAINQQGTPVLLVEQNARLALQVSKRAYIIERGNVNIEGPSEMLKNDPRVREAYLGKNH
ncbi:MAG: ABC transporter ATP-binding protein [Clostridia bacterium]|nr:ABC transporter ATP-binding protein [Clostridia bacterium]